MIKNMYIFHISGHVWTTSVLAVLLLSFILCFLADRKSRRSLQLFLMKTKLVIKRDVKPLLLLVTSLNNADGKRGGSILTQTLMERRYPPPLSKKLFISYHLDICAGNQRSRSAAVQGAKQLTESHMSAFVIKCAAIERTFSKMRACVQLAMKRTITLL